MSVLLIENKGNIEEEQGDNGTRKAKTTVFVFVFYKLVSLNLFI